METSNLILIREICVHHKIEMSFIQTLNSFGLIEIISVENNHYISGDQLKDLEKMIRLHYELDINMEGIDVISNLLKRIEHLQEELNAAKNRLRRHEAD